MNDRPRLSGARRFAALGVLTLVFLAFHLPYLPSSLEDLDSINFALGLHRFDVAHHQPHPPGYPVFILVGKGARALIASDARALAAISLVAGTLGVLAIAALYRGMTSELPGAWTAAAAVLAITSPLYWFTAVRPLSDMAGLAAAVAVQAMTLAARTDLGLAGVAFSAGVVAGIRSQVFWLTVPLLIWRGWKGRHGRRRDEGGGEQERQRAAGGVIGRLSGLALAFAGGVLMWLVPLAILSGGPAAYWQTVSSQGAEDLSGVRMLWTTPTVRTFVDALYFACVAPWATWPVATLVLALASVGVRRLRREDPRALMLVAFAFGAYFLFDLLFQETFTSRYALPLVVPFAFLATAGLRALPAIPAILLAASIAMFQAHIGGVSIASYARDEAPAFRMLTQMRLAGEAAPVKPVFAPDRRQSLDLRRPLIWLGDAAPGFNRQLAAPPQHEWLEAVKYWNAGGRAPVWFAVDPTRAAIELVQHDDPASYRWSLPYPVLLSGIRPSDVDWYQVPRPDWYVGEGWPLTPESAGVAAVDHRGLQYGPIEGWVRRAALGGGALVLGGRNFEAAGRSLINVSVGRSWSTAMGVGPGAFLDVVRVPSLVVESPAAEYVKLTISATPPADIAVEQFDVSSFRSVVGFGRGWYEPEFNPVTGQRWRWVSERGELRYVTPDDSGAILRLQGESPRKYYSRASRIVVRAGERVLREVTVADDFSLDVTVPAALTPSTLVVETDQTHVPAESWWRRTNDRRRLGLRIFRCVLRSVER